MNVLTAARLGTLAVLSAALAACGGGGGGGGTPTPPTPTTYTIGGNLTGLASGASVVLQNNGGGNLTLNSNAPFTFATPVNSGAAYAVTVLTQPTSPTQTCSVANGSGSASANVTNVAVTCTTASFAISGTVSGLVGSIVIQNNGGSSQTIAANGNFSFAAQASGSAYAITVQSHPTGPNQTCTVANGSGTIGSAAVSNVAITCSTTTHTLGGTVSGLAGTGLVLRDTSGQTVNVTGTGNVSFTFPTALASGATYGVTVQTQPASPAQTCIVTNGSGTIGAANVSNVAVACSTNAYTLGGTVTGLAAGGTVVLQNNGANNLSVTANGPFTFAGTLNPGANYAVTVVTHPTVPGPGQNCTVQSGTGSIVAANVTNVAIVCANSDQTAPTVTARTPLPTTVGTKLQGGVVTVTFSEAVNPSTVNTSSFSVQGPGGPVSGSVSLAGGNTQATFTPSAALAFDASYTVTLSTTIRDPSNNALPAAVSWSFNTGKKLALGFQHTCARFTDGRVKCWGANGAGQLGVGDTSARGDSAGEVPNNLAAVDLGTGRTAVAITAGDYHTCAILDNGDTKCWGENRYGELGQGRIDNGPSYGLGDEPNELGDVLAPINLGAGRRALELAPGQGFTCARLDNGSVKCWGLNTSGQLGQGNVTALGVTAGDIAAAAPVSLGTGLTPLQLSAGHYHVCAILQDGAGAKQTKCWGDNRWGQLGLGDTDNRGDGGGEMGASLSALDLGGTPDFLMATGGHNCAKLGTGAVKCWGLNTWGEVGSNDGNSNPAGNRLLCSGGANDCIGDQANEMGANLDAAIASGADRLSIGFRHSCALLTNGQLKCWGSNEQAQLGLGDIVAPKDIIGDGAGEMAALATTALQTGGVIEELSAGGFHSCVWYTNDTLNCWGSNSAGQLGRNDTANQGDSPAEMGDGLLEIDLGP